MNWTEEEYAEYLKKKGVPTERKKKSKYRNKRPLVDGIYFDSQLEADFYNDLKLQLRMGTIKGFCRQPEFVLLEGFAGQRPETYKADFIVFNLDGTAEIIDTKGIETEVFRIKQKQFRVKFPGLKLKVEKARTEKYKKEE